MATAKIALQYTGFQCKLRISLMLARREGAWCVCHLQRWEMRSFSPRPISAQSVDATGGAICCRLEEGFPIFSVNTQLCTHFGYPSQQQLLETAQGKLLCLLHPDDRARVEKEFRNAGTALEFRMREYHGGYLWVRASCRIVESPREGTLLLCGYTDITRERLAWDELFSIYNNIPGAVFRCRFDEQWSVLEANDGLFTFLGYTREEFAALGSCMAAVIHPDDQAVMADKINAQLAGGNMCVQNEHRLICKDGTVKWISVKGQLMRDEQDERFFYIVFVDITEHMELLRRVREEYERELRYSTALVNPNLLTKLCANLSKNRIDTYKGSVNTTVAYSGIAFSAAIENLAETAIDVETGKQLYAMFDICRLTEAFRIGQAQPSFDYRRKCADGGVIWCRMNARMYQNPDTDDLMLFLYCFDITEQKINELVLERTANIGYDYICEIDLHRDQYHVLSWNGDTKLSFPKDGCYSQEYMGILERHAAGEDAVAIMERISLPVLEQQLKQAECYTLQYPYLQEENNVRTKRLQYYYIDEFMGRVCLARSDMTDVVAREERQREELAAALAAAQQANAAKSDFLSRMSHEIRTPMNAIIGMSTIAAQAIGDDEQVADCISKICISSRFLLALINDILDMSRIESGKLLLKNEMIPTAEFLTGINTLCYGQAEGKGVDFECVVDPALDDYYVGDAMKLQQVLLNVLSNAIKFTDEGGKVTFSAEQRKKTKNYALLRFIINDTGIGMTEDFIPHIFEPFCQESSGTTSMYGGTGLGLAIAKNIVDMMDGHISIRSIRGIGSEFTVDVHVGITKEEKKHEKHSQHRCNFSHLKTLVVDDDVSVCESAILTLQEMGVKAEWVDSGRKAIERVSALHDQSRYFDMILIDWKMPEMDGVETTRQIRRIVGPEVTIIIMTAYDWAVIENEAKLAGVNLLMSKPMFKSSIISAFTKALGQKENIQERAPAQRDFHFDGQRVLLVEDHPLNTEIAFRLLTQKGLHVECAENGLRALEMFSKSDPGYYSAILMDIRMPIMDGLTATTNIRHLSNVDATSVPIIAMTANAFDDDVEKSKRAGMVAHLSKPIEPQKLYQVLYDYIVEDKEHKANE
ncbi:MAG: response regulator [Clostridia bacterium]